MKEIFRSNNFDLIRLFAALQVAIHHALIHLNIEYDDTVIHSLLGYFPGVPIFFFVSGFLISKSYENNSFIKEYAQNRILRIFPALIVCTIISLISVYLTGYFSNREISIIEFIVWFFGQVSIYQFYNPEFMREFGTGVLNGSLWTITVELQFYFAVPILYWLCRFNKNYNNWKLLSLISFFMIFHAFRYYYIDVYGDDLKFKIFGVSFIPWIYMFLIGVFFQKNFNIFYRLLSGKIVYVLPFYLAVSYLLTDLLGWRMGNGIDPVLFVLLAIVIFTFAYSYTTYFKNILRGNDISYGIYIYHIPVINILIYYGYISNFSYLVIAILVTILIAIFSWRIVEKNSLLFKKHPLNPLNSN